MLYLINLITSHKTRLKRNLRCNSKNLWQEIITKCYTFEFLLWMKNKCITFIQLVNKKSSKEFFLKTYFPWNKWKILSQGQLARRISFRLVINYFDSAVRKFFCAEFIDGSQKQFMDLTKPLLLKHNSVLQNKLIVMSAN